MHAPRKPRKKFDPDAFMKNARHLSAPISASGDNSGAGLDEILYFVHQIKNGMTVKTGEHEALTRLFTGQKMYVDTRDVSLAPHIMLDGVWEKELTDLILSLLNEDTVFFDIGANFGYFGTVAGTKIKTGSIHFFEPNPLLANYIRKSVSINGLSGISSLAQVAVGDKRGSATLHLPTEHFGSASIRSTHYEKMAQEPEDPTEKIQVEQMSVDEYVSKTELTRVDIVKIDIEGFEDAAYLGMRETIGRNPGLVLFLEFTPVGYANPREFFKELLTHFKNCQMLTHTGFLSPVEKYEDVEKAESDFVMLVLSNRNI